MSPDFAVAKVLQSGEMPGWVFGGVVMGSSVVSDVDGEVDADRGVVVFAPSDGVAAKGGGARTYQPPGGEVQRVCPGFREEHEVSRVGFQTLSCAVVKFPVEETMSDSHVVVLVFT